MISLVSCRCSEFGKVRLEIITLDALSRFRYSTGYAFLCIFFFWPFLRFYSRIFSDIFTHFFVTVEWLQLLSLRKKKSCSNNTDCSIYDDKLLIAEWLMFLSRQRYRTQEVRFRALLSADVFVDKKKNLRAVFQSRAIFSPLVGLIHNYFCGWKCKISIFTPITPYTCIVLRLDTFPLYLTLFWEEFGD